MLRRTLLTVMLALSALTSAAIAEPVAMKASEIEAALAGNTISGTWNGSEYQQYYATGGLTVYIPANGKPDEGKWRVDPATDNYESWWRSTGWTPYKILRDGESFLWVDSGGKHHPFVVLKGKQVTW